VVRLVSSGTDMKHFLETLIERVHTALLAKAGVEGGVEDSSLDINDLKTLIELLAKAHTDIKHAVLPSLPLEIAVIEWGITRGSMGAEVAYENFLVHDAKELKASSRIANPASVHSENFVPSPRHDNLLEDLITKIKPHNHSIAGVLRGCTLKAYNGKEMVIETKYKFHKDKLTEPKTLALIEKICKEISGEQILVSVLKS